MSAPSIMCAPGLIKREKFSRFYRLSNSKLSALPTHISILISVSSETASQPLHESVNKQWGRRGHKDETEQTIFRGMNGL